MEARAKNCRRAVATYELHLKNRREKNLGINELNRLAIFSLIIYVDKNYILKKSFFFISVF